MWNKKTETRRRIALILGQFIVLVLCILYIQGIYFANILPDKRVIDEFNEVACFLVSKQLSSRGHVITSYRADFLINYEIAGVQYNRWVSGNGLDMSYFHNQAAQEDILTQYEIGQSYTCFYKPSNPEIAILVLRHNWLSTFPLMLPSVIFILVAYFMYINIIKLWEKSQVQVKLKTRKYRKKAKRKKSSES